MYSMKPSITRALRLSALALACAAMSVHAAPLAITFDSIVVPAGSDAVYLPSYSEGGYDFASSVGGFGSWDLSHLNSRYHDSPALFNAGLNDIFAGIVVDPPSVTTLTRHGGGAFNLLSIDLSELYNLDSDIGSTITFIADKVGGGTATEVVDLDGQWGSDSYQTFSFGSGFANVTAVRWAQVLHYHQFDNVVVEDVEAPGGGVPEPGSLALAGLALLGVAVARTRARR